MNQSPLTTADPRVRRYPTARIIIATHKEYRMPSDHMYVPMQLGAALSSEDLLSGPHARCLKDNLGENISTRNPSFCELTGLYWAWKHLHEDYVGLVHYRRHFRGDGQKKSGIRGDIFDHVLRYDELCPMLGKYKVFVPRKRHYVIETLQSHYAHTHYQEHLDRTREILLEKYPDYVEAFDETMKQTGGHMFNMMIMERHLLDEYCTWLFDILFTLENRVDVSDYNFYQGRYSGRVGELIFNVWLRYQVESGDLKQDDIKVLPYLYVEKINWFIKAGQFLRAKFLHQRYDAHWQRK